MNSNKKLVVKVQGWAEFCIRGLHDVQTRHNWIWVKVLNQAQKLPKEHEKVFQLTLFTVYFQRSCLARLEPVCPGLWLCQYWGPVLVYAPLYFVRRYRSKRLQAL